MSRAVAAGIGIWLAFSTSASAARFEDYPVAAYNGPRHAPDFTGPGKKYRNFHTVISQGFRNGRGFAGHYVLFAVGCGAGCRSVTLGDLATGKILDFPLGGEENYNLEFQVQADSRLVKTEWEVLGNQTTCSTADLVLKGSAFSRKDTGTKPGNCPDWYGN
jgi:hypothetical protein